MARVATRPPLTYYLNLKYPIMVYEDPDGGYAAEIPDLPGCFTQAETPDELMEMIEDAKHAWIESAYEDGCEIPLPRTESGYSGKFILRVGTGLHRRLVLAAADEGVSLNQYVVQLVSGRGDLDTVLRRMSAIEQRMASIEQSLYYTFGSVPSRSAVRKGWAKVVPIAAGGKEKIRQAVAS